LILGAVAVLAVVLVPVFLAGFQTDASVPLDGLPHSVRLDGTGEREIWFPDIVVHGVGCQVLDAETMQPLTLRTQEGTATRDVHNGPERAMFRFSPMSEYLVVTCGGPGRTPHPAPLVEIGPAIGMGGFAGTVAVLLGTIALFGLGLVSLAVLIVLFVTRGPRGSVPA
jgi:hypothetical protein